MLWQVDERRLIPIELDSEGKPDIDLYERIFVDYEDVQKECLCVGWNATRDGFDIKTNEFWLPIYSNKVPMENVKIIISTRELRLRDELAKVQAAN